MVRAVQDSGEIEVKATTDSHVVAADNAALAAAWLAVMGWGDPEALRYLACSLDRVDDEEVGTGD
jgi:hypothetical protein